jgi:solute carrier family 25 citrate transporter 1
VIKIRLQALHKAPNGTLVPRYKSTSDAISTLIRTEGIGFFWRGVTLTALRQGTNQAANFTVYTELKTRLQVRQQPQHYPGNQVGVKELPSYQTTIIGLVSGAVGPFFNAPIDTIKTRIQQTPAIPGKSSLSHIMTITTDMLRREGIQSFYKGITPRVMRVAPGQAVTFTVYEFLKGRIEESYIIQRHVIRQAV